MHADLDDEETPKISSRTESTTRRTVGAKPSTSTTSLTKKPTLKPPDEKDKTRVANAKTTATVRSTTTKTRTQTSTTSTSSRTTPRAVNPTRKPADPKQNAITQRTTAKVAASTSKQPLRAKHTTEIKEAIQKTTLAKSANIKSATKIANAKPNAVLDTPLNVTVSSPPARRKNITPKEEENVEPPKEPKVKLTRKGSRVLAPDEIVVLKRESAKKRLEDQIRRESIEQQEQQNSLTPCPDPVAFEVTFDDKEKRPKEKDRPKSEARERSRSRVRPTTDETKTEDEERNYSDDFDSYESDFDTESSQHESSQHASEESEDVSEETTEEEQESSDEEASDAEINAKQLDETEDESELTQDPITVLQRDKERKLDSGHYEMNSRRNPKLSEMSSQSTQPLMDSLEAFSLNTSDQLDSGISAYGPLISHTHNTAPAGNFQIYYGGYKEFITKPVLNKRGSDLMSKIQFDTLGYTLFDLKPISYDVYMQTYGRLNTGQCATQTQDDLMHVEQQTEPYEMRSMWTQHPAQYDLQMVQQLYKEGSSFKGILSQNCCGELEDSAIPKSAKPCDLEQSLETLKALENQRYKRNVLSHMKNQRKPINFDNLNAFLLRSSLVINQILGSSGTKTQSMAQPQQFGNLEQITESCYEMNTNFLNTLKVVKIFSNSKHNLLVTVHESLPETDVYKSDFTQLLMVWCISTSDKPIRLLTTWSDVARVEVSHDSADIIVAALRDGSVALWDLRETYSFCSKLDGCLTHFAATQSIVPSWGGHRGKAEILMDLGSCLDVRSFRGPTNAWSLPSSAMGSYSKSQFVSLHDSGILTVWTLVETKETTASVNLLNSSQKSDKLKYSSKMQQKFDYSSPWARVKLIQSSMVYLKDYLESKSKSNATRFDKTKALFQKNIYSDEALKELHENTEEFGQQGLRFTSIECGSETIYICTNRNFIMMCSKTLKPERFRRITLNESRLLFPTALQVLSNENYLAVGLSNGAVMILNCALNKQLKPKSARDKCKTPLTPFPGQQPSADIDSITGKSCAIQNIVLNSQKSYNSMDFNANAQDEFRPTTAAFIALIDSQQKPFELRVYDQQVILSGSVLRRNLIQSLELSSDGWRLFALTNNRIRVYDFYMDQEICTEEEMSEAGNVMDIGCGKASQNEMNLMTMARESKVSVYVLKK